jgi:hypothetical protein
MKANTARQDKMSSYLESEYCASVAATLMARTEYFELLEDAMVSPGRLVRALRSWRRYMNQTQVLGGLVGTA